MSETFDGGMTVEVLTSDGEYTIGYVDDRAAQWSGNMKVLKVGDQFDFMYDGSYFGVNSQDEYRVDADRRWEDLGE
jgi:hypothetical protein